MTSNRCGEQLALKDSPQFPLQAQVSAIRRRIKIGLVWIGMHPGKNSLVCRRVVTYLVSRYLKHD